MHYYLTGWKGTGTDADPFTPDIGDAQGWAVIDLRPDPTRTAGVCLLACQVRPAVDPVAAIYLGNDGNAALPTLTRTRLEKALEVTLSATSVLGIAVELLTKHAGGARWKPLTPARTPLGAYRWDVLLGDLHWQAVTAEPVL